MVIVTTVLNGAACSEGSKILQENQRRSVSVHHPVRSVGSNQRNSMENKMKE